MSAAAATAMVDRLAARGHVERAPHHVDRRRVVVRPTGDRGPEYRRIDDDLKRAMADHSRAFSAEELATVLRFMEGASTVLSEVTEHLRDEARQRGERTRRS
jgi:DNA-binding MarR family transcriptional regulator